MTAVGLLLALLALFVGGARAKESLASEVDAQVPHWVSVEQLPPSALPGARVFARSGCTTCHTYLGAGARNLGAHDLTAIGRRHGVRFFERYVANPGRFGNRTMPRFAALGKLRLHRLALFLAASEGPR